MKLGQKVECSSYLKKKAIPYVFANDKHVKKYNEEYKNIPDNYLTLEVEDVEDCMYLDTKEIIKKILMELL